MKKYLKLLVILALFVSILLPPAAYAYPTSCYLSVDIFPNEAPGICWACCVSSCINYVKGADTTPYTMEVHTGYYGPAPWSAIGTCLTDWGCVYNSASSKPSFSTVQASIASGEPVIVSCYTIIGAIFGSGAHAVELRGYYDGTNPSVSYFDPNYSTYRAQYYSTFTVVDGWPIKRAIYNPHPA